MVEIGSGAKKGFFSFKLSRFACYLIIQNADPTKEMVALGQKYFIIQTRKQEIQEQYLEDTRRKQLRDEMKKHNSSLAQTADKAGVKNYGIFTNYGYIGLYNGLDVTGFEFWSARDLMNVLGYKEWIEFEGVIEKTKNSCKNS